MTHAESDPCVFFKITSRDITILAVHVDDCTIAISVTSLANDLKR